MSTPQWDVLTRTRVELTSELLRLMREDEITAAAEEEEETTAAADEGGTK